MAYENILVETVDSAIGVVTLNRPQVLNALSYDLVRELNQALQDFDADPALRCVVITGAGEKAFSAGADIHEMAAATPEEMERRRLDRFNWTWEVATFRLPTIGAINGLAYGGAAVLSSSLDLRIGCERTKFRFLAAQYGRLNSTWSLPAVVGWPRAKELLYTARVVEADEAEKIGLLNKVVPSDRLMDEALAMARQIAKNTPEMVQGIKLLLQEDLGRSWREMYEAEATLLTTTHKPGPIQEGFKEFLDRKGRDRPR